MQRAQLARHAGAAGRTDCSAGVLDIVGRTTGVMPAGHRQAWYQGCGTLVTLVMAAGRGTLAATAVQTATLTATDYRTSTCLMTACSGMR